MTTTPQDADATSLIVTVCPIVAKKSFFLNSSHLNYRSAVMNINTKNEVILFLLNILLQLQTEFNLLQCNTAPQTIKYAHTYISL